MSDTPNTPNEEQDDESVTLIVDDGFIGQSAEFPEVPEYTED
jgi:hypothetical protein